MAKPNKSAGGGRELMPRWVVPGAVGLIVAYAGFNEWNNSGYETYPMTCTVGVPKKVAEGKVDPARPFAEFLVTTADTRSVARIVVAASVDGSRVPIAGLQVLRSKPVPKADAQKPSVASSLEALTVLANPADATNVNFVEGKGQTAILALDAKNTLEISVTQNPQKTSAELTASCIAVK
jgi:hypothetical protein